VPSKDEQLNMPKYKTKKRRKGTSNEGKIAK
jgi:hypothetical protein